MAADRQEVVKAILVAWITRNYDRIFPYLADKVVYKVGAGAAKSICHSPGVFDGKDKVRLWYDSHTWMLTMYGEAAVNPFCGFVGPPQVVVYEDPAQNTVIAVGTVGLGVPHELPCEWMSTWRFEGDLVVQMTLVADSVGGLDQFAQARQKVIAEVQAATLSGLKP